MSDNRSPLSRRAVLGTVLGLAGAAAASGCAVSRPTGTEPQPASNPPRSPGGAVLLAYFSRAGENYYNGGRKWLTVGNTENLANMIQRLTGCDVYRVEAADPYPDDYAPTVQRNVEEQNSNARPAIAKPLPSLDRYGTVLLGSPIWNIRAPMIMSTFTESFDFTGKTVHPFTTHAMSGLGNTERDYAASCRGATLAEGLAVRGEEVEAAQPAAEAWLRRIGLIA